MRWELEASGSGTGPNLWAKTIAASSPWALPGGQFISTVLESPSHGTHHRQQSMAGRLPRRLTGWRQRPCEGGVRTKTFGVKAPNWPAQCIEALKCVKCADEWNWWPRIKGQRKKAPKTCGTIRLHSHPWNGSPMCRKAMLRSMSDLLPFPLI